MGDGDAKLVTVTQDNILVITPHNNDEKWKVPTWSEYSHVQTSRAPLLDRGIHRVPSHTKPHCVAPR